MNKRAKFIVIEGADQVGKSDLIKSLISMLQSTDNTVFVAHAPPPGWPTDLVYRMLASGSAKRWPNLFQMLHFLSRHRFQRQRLQLQLETVDYVVMDRWKLSCDVYGNASGAWRWLTRLTGRFMIDPDITIVIDGPSRTRGFDDVYEVDSEFQQRVKQGYRDWVANNPGKGVLVDNNGSRMSTLRKTWDAIDVKLC